MSKRILLTLVLAASPMLAQSNPAASPMADARTLFKASSGNVRAAAEDVPEAKYGYKATPAVRSFGELFAHVAGSEAMFCAIALGEKAPAEDDIEKTATTKVQLAAALKSSAASCARAYAQSDAAASGMVDVFGQKHTRLYVLLLNAQHDNEHYGNLVTYMRLNSMVPPTSKPAPARK